MTPVPDASKTETEPLLAGRNFRMLWLAQLLSQVGQNAVLFTLLVIVISKTGSTTSSSVLVLSYVIPSVIFGMIGGLLVDRWRKRDILIASNVARCGAAVAFLFSTDHVWLLYVINLGFASVSQLFSTAEISTVPFLVSRQRLIAANSLVSLAWTASQFGGMVFLAPIFLKAFGSDALFIFTAALFLIAGGLARSLPQIEREREEGVPEQEAFLKTAPSEMIRALRLLRSDRASLLAMGQLTLSSSLVLLFAVLVPRFMQEVLRIRADDAVYVFAPTGIGAVLGLRLLPWLAGRIGKNRIVAFSLVGLAVSLVGLGMLASIADLLERTESLNPFGQERLGGLSLLVALAMLFAGPLGFFYAMVNAPAQTVLHERAPPEMRGRVFGAQLALASMTAIIPLLLVGAVGDLYGVSAVLLAIAVVAATVAALSILLPRRRAGVLKQGRGLPAALWRRLNAKRIPEAEAASSIDTDRGVG